MEPYLFGKRIKERREELGMTQHQLAAAIGVDQGKVSMIEKGARRIDVVRELPLIANALQSPIGRFFDEPGDKIPEAALVRQFYPNTRFTSSEIKRIAKFLEPIVRSYIENDPIFQKKLNPTKKHKDRA